MNDPAQNPGEDAGLAAALDQQADAAIAACNGDVRAALRAALVANSFLMAEIEELTRAVSLGFTRGKTPTRRASDKLDAWRQISTGKLPDDG